LCHPVELKAEYTTRLLFRFYKLCRVYSSLREIIVYILDFRRQFLEMETKHLEYDPKQS